MARTRSAVRQQVHDEAREQIKTVARRQMAEQGTAAVGLRAIAREMEMTAPALYRYFPSLDDLITALILDAFNALADAMEDADAAQPADAYADRLYAVMLAYRDWAVTHPTDFLLIYGNPIPGYEAPAEQTIMAARRGLVVVTGILSEAAAAGALDPRLVAVPDTVAAHLRSLETGIAEAILKLSVDGWVLMHGLIMLELMHHTPPFLGDPAAYYDHRMREQLTEMGLPLTTA